MKERIDFIVKELTRLSKESSKDWEVIFRYLVKLNSYLSKEDLCNDELLLTSFSKLLKIKDSEVKTIIKIYYSRIIYNRANKLDKPIYIGEILDKKIPSFVDKSKLKGKENLFTEDPLFLEKNIHIRGGWLNLKNNKSFTFNI